MKKKIFAGIAAAAMALSLVACGQAPATNETPATDATDAPAVEEVTVTPSIDFEDGNFAFVGNDTKSVGGTKEATLSVADYNGSKALKVEPQGNSNIAFQMDALLGADADKVAKIQATIGTESADGTFRAASGVLTTAQLGATVDSQGWSVYLESANPKVVELSEINSLIGFSSGDLFTIALNDDLQNAEIGVPTVYYIDNVAFLDADGNTLAVDTSAEFVVADSEEDRSNLWALSGAEEVGQAASGAGWSQADIIVDANVISTMGPDDVIEISYSSKSGNMWVVMSQSDAGWMRVGVGDTDGSGQQYAYMNNSRTTAQITWDQIAAVCGSDPTTWGPVIQAESDDEWEVYSVKKGVKTNRLAVTKNVSIEEMYSADAWAQAGPTMTDEFKAALVPGSSVIVDYASESGEIWLVFPGSDKGWMRVGVGDYDGSGQGYMNCDGSVGCISYEQIAAILGDDVSTWGDVIQLEASTPWEAYSVSVGKANSLYAQNNVKTIEEYHAASGWGQDGPTMTDEFKAALTPDSVIDVEYTSESGEIWLVFPGSDAGWMRVGVGDYDGSGQGYMTCTGSHAEITFEQIAEYLGDDVSKWGDVIQCEASTNWEIYSISVGQRK